MAVVVQCYNCSNMLELDDGFRGGVCRCSQCGSLLQVPKEPGGPGRQARPAAPDAKPTDVKRPGAPTDTGLSRGQFDPRSGTWGGKSPAEAHGSSGTLSQMPGRETAKKSAATFATAEPDLRDEASPTDADIGLSLHRPPAILPHRAPKKSNTLLVFGLIGGLVLIAIVLVVIVIGMIGNSSKPTNDGAGTGANALTPGNAEAPGAETEKIGNPNIITNGPNFLYRIPLVGKKILFSLDAASSAQDSFDYLRKGVALSINSMAPDQQYKIALWREGNLEMFPAIGWEKRDSKKPIEQLHGAAPNGATDAAQSLKSSVEIDADQIIIVTAKSALDPTVADGAMAVRRFGQRVDVVRINSGDDSSPLNKLAKDASGTNIQLDSDKLEEILRDK